MCIVFGGVCDIIWGRQPGHLLQHNLRWLHLGPLTHAGAPQRTCRGPRSPRDFHQIRRYCKRGFESTNGQPWLYRRRHFAVLADLAGKNCAFGGSEHGLEFRYNVRAHPRRSSCRYFANWCSKTLMLPQAESHPKRICYAVCSYANAILQPLHYASTAAVCPVGRVNDCGCTKRGIVSDVRAHITGATAKEHCVNGIVHNQPVRFVQFLPMCRARSARGRNSTVATEQLRKAEEGLFPTHVL